MHTKSSCPMTNDVNRLDDDDDWTLQKWQQLLKQGSRHKRSKRLCNSEQEISKSMDHACSTDQYSVALDTCIVHKTNSYIDGVPQSIGGTDSIMVDTMFKGNHESARSESEPVEVKLYRSNQWPPCDGAVQGDSLHVAASSQPLSSVMLQLEDESEMTAPPGFLPERLQTTSNDAWSLKPCRKVQSTVISNLVLTSSHSRTGTRSISETPSRKAFNLSGVQSRGACLTPSWQRKQSLVAGSGNDISGPEEMRRTTLMDGSEGICKSKPVLSKAIRQTDDDRTCSSGYTSIPSKLIEGAVPREQFVGNKLSEQGHSCLSAGCSDVSSTFDNNEGLEIEEEQELQGAPAKIPCKRKAISPMLQEFLLKASKLGNCGINAKTKGFKGSVRLPESKRSGALISFGQQGQKPEGLQGSGLFRKPKGAFSEAVQTNAFSLTQAEKCVAEAFIGNSQETSETHNSSKALSTSPAALYPSVPPKGILRSSSQACQGPCNCEECASLRSRAERASEFSQRQMQDIEGLAVKLMKDLSTLRNIVEDRLIQSPSMHQGARPSLSLDQVKKATGKALETEETAKRWLVRMARDCNRYCKIMRMQGRKLTFADESGGKLCHIKVFHSEPVLDTTAGVNGRPSEVDSCTSSPQSAP